MIVAPNHTHTTVMSLYISSSLHKNKFGAYQCCFKIDKNVTLSFVPEQQKVALKTSHLNMGIFNHEHDFIQLKLLHKWANDNAELLNRWTTFW